MPSIDACEGHHFTKKNSLWQAGWSVVQPRESHFVHPSFEHLKSFPQMHCLSISWGMIRNSLEVQSPRSRVIDSASRLALCDDSPFIELIDHIASSSQRSTNRGSLDLSSPTQLQNATSKIFHARFVAACPDCLECQNSSVSRPRSDHKEQFPVDSRCRSSLVARPLNINDQSCIHCALPVTAHQTDDDPSQSTTADWTNGTH
jgi:hypothetical protein